MAKCTFLYFSSASTCLLFICGLICHAYLYWNCRLISQPLIIQMSIENIDHRLMLASSESVSDTRSYQMNSRNSRVPSLNSPNVPALPQTKPRAAQHSTARFTHKRTTSTHPDIRMSSIRQIMFTIHTHQNNDVSSTEHAFKHHRQLIFCRSQANTTSKRVKILSLFVFNIQKFAIFYLNLIY